MISGGHTRAGAERLPGSAPAAPGPVQDLESIIALIELGALLRADGRPGETFTFDQLMTEVRGLLDEGQTVAQRDIAIVLPGVRCCRKVKGGYRWR